MRLLPLLFLLPLLSGCLTPEGSPATSQATVVVDFDGFRAKDPQQVQEPVAFDPGRQPTMALYSDTGRPDAYTVHDLMSDWSNQTGTRIDVRHHAAFGYVLQEVDSVVAHSSQGGSWSWALHVDGERVTEGMSTVVVQDGSVYGWVFEHQPR